ncbi:terpene synthase family protein [Streptomyces sp. P1-3]|uniref:terpene synthase family protein n=1 Tax=Streptomyces sp. P1-3 TaxID=3421658 RepID=UPI003D35B608
MPYAAYMPFPPVKVDPDQEQRAYGYIWQWVGSSNLCKSPEQRRKLAISNTHSITTAYYDMADEESFRPLARWMALSFVIDDFVDEGINSEDGAACAKAVQGLVALFSGGKPRTDIQHAAASLAADIMRGRSPAWRASFRRNVCMWLWASYASNIDQLASRRPSLDEYMRVRRTSLGQEQFIDLLEIAVGVDLPESVRHLPCIREIRLAVVEHMAFGDDVVSLPKEIDAGVEYNAVRVVEYDRGVGRHAALEQVIGISNAAVRRYELLREELPRQLDAVGIRGKQRDDVIRFAHACQQMIRANHDFLQTAGRYAAGRDMLAGLTFRPD